MKARRVAKKESNGEKNDIKAIKRGGKLKIEEGNRMKEKSNRKAE